MQAPKRATAVLDVRPMLRGSEKAVVEAVLGRIEPAGQHAHGYRKVTMLPRRGPDAPLDPAASHRPLEISRAG